MSGYRVVLNALRDASEGVDGLLLNVRSEPLRSGSFGVDALADARLVAAVDRFLSRWRTGIDLLVGDAEAVSVQLRRSVEAYEAADHTTAQAFISGPGRAPIRPRRREPTRRWTRPRGPAAVTELAADLASYASVLGQAGDGLRRIDTSEGWEGDAGDAFRAAFEGEPARWSDAAAAFTAAADALDRFAMGLAWAQDRAAEAATQPVDVAGGGLLVAASALGEVGGVALDATGVGLPVGLGLGAASTAGIVAGVGIAGAAGVSLAANALGPDRVQVFHADANPDPADATPEPPFPAPTKITGRTDHGEQRINNSRGDGGVNDEALEDAVANPKSPPKFRPDDYGGTYVYKGRDATVSLNERGEITSAWPKGNAGRRIPR